MKRAKWLKTAVTGAFIVTAGICYTFFVPKEKNEVEILRGENNRVLAEGPTASPLPSPTGKSEENSGLTGENPDKKEENPKPSPTTTVERNLININTADSEELIRLPGIGELRARCIIAYRSKNGDFKSIEEIMLVSGIKNGIFSKIKDKICTGYE